jgi:hypothetical protein
VNQPRRFFLFFFKPIRNFFEGVFLGHALALFFGLTTIGGNILGRITGVFFYF